MFGVAAGRRRYARWCSCYFEWFVVSLRPVYINTLGMLGIKRLYLFILRSFVPLFVMTFFISLFVLLMQYLYMRIDDLVGKGLGIDVIAELFMYAAISLVPLALPLAILLASLMTFGNLGERFELTAMKASGVSLIKAMRPLIVLMVLVSVGAFFFQNYVLPVAQTKMWTLVFSVKQKSPELEIPEGVFYDQIPGYNLYVDHKNRDDGKLYDVMIYDVSRGFENSSIILADSGKLAMTDDKTHLFLYLWDGESFENLREAGAGAKNVPYRRESFADKEILLKFDANFSRMDEESMRSQHVGKNIEELRATIDSVEVKMDSVGTEYARIVAENTYFGLPYYTTTYDNKSMPHQVRTPDVDVKRPVNVDSIFKGRTSGIALNYLNQALMRAKRMKQDYEFKSLTISDDRNVIRRHTVELMRKYTLSFACIIFFFIGAPLGAIIRKGGIGMPLVVSVLLFIFYYFIDTMGLKMARDGKLEAWEGVWLSTAVLLPLGAFLTYKAVNDSAVFNRDAYVNFFRRLIGSNEVRKVEMRTVVMDEVEPDEALKRLDELTAEAKAYVGRYPGRQNYVDYWLKGYSRTALRSLSALLEQTVDYLTNSRDKMVIIRLMDFPVLRSLWLYHPTNYPVLGWVAIVLFPIGLPLYIAGTRQQLRLKAEIETIIRDAAAVRELIAEKQEQSN